MTRKIIVTLFLVAWLTCAGNVAFSQKNTSQKNDERNENARVAKAERALADARKDLAETQQALKKELEAFEKATRSLPQWKKKLRDAREDAEDRLGAKVGIPDALAKVRNASAELEQIAIKVRVQVHQTPDWIQANLAAIEAKKKKIALLDDLSDEVDQQVIAGLTKIVLRPVEFEDEAISKDPDAIEATNKLKTHQADLDKKRKLLPEGKVDQDPKVVKSISELQSHERSLVEIEKSLRKTKAEASKIQKQFAEATTELQRAKAADAADRNRPQKNKK